MTTLFRCFMLCVVLGGSALAELRYPAVFEAEQSAVLSAERAGVLEALPVVEGQWIKKGQLLAQVDHKVLARDLKATRFKLAYVKKQLANYKHLNNMKMAANDDVDKTRMERDVAYTDIEFLKAKISRSAIRAPFGGMVQELLVRRHEWVTEGMPVIKITNPTRLRVVSSIPTAVAVKLKSGANYKVVAPDAGGYRVSAKLVAKIPLVDVQSNTVKVVWRVTSKRGVILPGMKAWVLLP